MPKRKRSSICTKNKKNSKKNQHFLQGTTTLNLPPDILIEILSRLPASSLSRFKRVCRPWRTLITTDPVLMNSNLDRGFTSGHTSIVILTGFRDKDSLLTLMDLASGRKHSAQCMKAPYSRISPCCNGLVCAYSYPELNLDLALFNPTTRKRLSLFPAPVAVSRWLALCFLGYVSTTKEYKVVLFYTGPSSIQVRTVGTSSWREVSINIYQAEKGVVINGVIYCMVITLEDTYEIVSFDLSNEKFETISFLMDVDRIETIQELDGRLCVTISDRNKSMAIWMLENIATHSWVKRFVLSISGLEPILIHEEKILVKSYKELQIRDLKTGIFCKRIYYDYGWDYKFHAQVHIESLVSFEAL